MLLLGVSADAWACKCVPPSMGQDFARADVVCAGRVTRFDLVDGWLGLTTVYLRHLWSELTGRPDPFLTKWYDSRRNGNIADFEIHEVLKGRVPRRTSVYTGYGTGDCGYDFKVGHE